MISSSKAKHATERSLPTDPVHEANARTERRTVRMQANAVESHEQMLMLQQMQLQHQAQVQQLQMQQQQQDASAAAAAFAAPVSCKGGAAPAVQSKLLAEQQELHRQEQVQMRLGQGNDQRAWMMQQVMGRAEKQREEAHAAKLAAEVQHLYFLADENLRRCQMSMVEPKVGHQAIDESKVDIDDTVAFLDVSAI